MHIATASFLEINVATLFVKSYTFNSENSFELAT
jgi:hypothetical protein